MFADTRSTVGDIAERNMATQRLAHINFPRKQFTSRKDPGGNPNEETQNGEKLRLLETVEKYFGYTCRGISVPTSG